jgi:hypothetical protein
MARPAINVISNGISIQLSFICVDPTQLRSENDAEELTGITT